MVDIIEQFEADCAEAGVQPHEALRAGGVHASLWWRWKSGTGPTLRNWQRARAGLASLIKQKEAA